MRRSLMLAGLLLALIAPTAARAEFKGTPGKIVYIEDDESGPLKLWDPAAEALDPGTLGNGITTLDPETYVQTTSDVTAFGSPSTPVWSPDGTKIAYVKSIPDEGNSPSPLTHTAIFVYDLVAGRSSQLTQPPDALVDTDPNEPTIGHLAADFSPAWSPDGNTIVFIRDLSAWPDDELKPQRGRNLWRVPAAGGGQTRVTSYGMEPPYVDNGAVWINGTNDVLVGVARPGDSVLARQPIGGGGATPVAAPDTIIGDYDVSPDGKRFAYSVVSPSGGFRAFAGDLSTGTARDEGELDGPQLRFSNTGSGLLHPGCRPEPPEVCGLLERQLEDPGADAERGDERVLLAWELPTGVLGGAGIPARSGFDVQPQTLPVIFIPGFLGSQITCGADEAWPDMPFPDLLPMRLADDGVANADCPSAGPTGELVETVLGADIYKSVADHVRAKFGVRGTLFGWDWRKRPQESFGRLDQAISDALARDGPWVDQQAGRVVLWGHSYGGLLIRSYIAGPGGARVARVLTEGTPYWGSPKAVFPLAFGIESPLFSPMDFFIGNSRMKALARNLAGLYQLYPSDHYPAWLTVDGAGQDQAGVAAFVGAIGGNQALLEQARGYHTSLYDGFYDFGGRIDVHALAGTGKETIRSVVFSRDAWDGSVDVTGRFGNGDATVPAESASQVTPGGAPLGDPAHVHYVCDIEHVPLPGAASVLDAYDDFLDSGARRDASPRRRATRAAAATRSTRGRSVSHRTRSPGPRRRRPAR